MTVSYSADVIIVGLGAAGSCAAIAAHDAGASVIVIEKQPHDAHLPNTRRSQGGFHSPDPDGDREALMEYATAMFSGRNLPNQLEGEQEEFVDELARIWADNAPQNAEFMRGLDSSFQTPIRVGAAFPDFPGAAESKYGVAVSTYTGQADETALRGRTSDTPKELKESGEAFYACLMMGIESRSIPVHFATAAADLIIDATGEITGVRAKHDDGDREFHANRAVIIASGGFEYNPKMRKAFLPGPGIDGWAFYGSEANTGDGIQMALRAGAALSAVGMVAGRVICAIPERRNGLRIGLNTSGVGKPNEIVVDNGGRRYASERTITKDPSRYFFYKDALHFDTQKLEYPRIPSWMIFDATMMDRGPVISLPTLAYHGLEWGEDNRKALEQGWILTAPTLELLGEEINRHSDSRKSMDAKTLAATVDSWNDSCARGYDADFERDPATMGPVITPPFYAIPLYPGGPNTKGGIRADARRRVLDWNDEPIPRLYAAGEICSVFQFAYQGGGNLAEGIVFGRVAGAHAAAETPHVNGR
ncbi:succinate dehydrogenase/fumarate reductase flavoprotein subunit [Antricoccus suffuscus]|uniref:Succinate dehydrogenase/fumarate reductase flavoprotein subunit n=1 Tax=Antricoccus suffuscus TaxID=1629062 RepID=A0A2T1A1T9_9ACTN|nr:succinate dehydrogenase/fumarate reductase flavoprotein subunit [Antricoccus suffuscus]